MRIATIFSPRRLRPEMIAPARPSCIAHGLLTLVWLRNPGGAICAPCAISTVRCRSKLAAASDVHSDDAAAGGGVSHVVSIQLEAADANQRHGKCVRQRLGDADPDAQR